MKRGLDCKSESPGSTLSASPSDQSACDDATESQIEAFERAIGLGSTMAAGQSKGIGPESTRPSGTAKTVYQVRAVARLRSSKGWLSAALRKELVRLARPLMFPKLAMADAR